MDRLRRSFRSSWKRKKDRSQSLDAASPPPASLSSASGSVVKNTEYSVEPGKPQQWQQDEIAVRSGISSFQVKYLGCVEVFSSRGMEVCEEAVKVLKNSKRKSVRSVLYVSGDGLRVVDDETRGLILDQTIEKVSFCAPDRNFDRGFSYICRDGTTRRWMCHGFMAVRDSGERLSHAVGCAFAICLERKQKRDSECAVSLSFDSKNTTFTRVGSFRQASLTERLQDPQGIKPCQPPPAAPDRVENPYAIARPHATDLMLQRQTSFRGFSHLQASGNSPFKRQLSLRLSDLPSTLERQRTSALATLDRNPDHSTDISNMCQKLSAGLAFLTAEPTPSMQKFQDHGLLLPGRSLVSSSPLQPVPEHQELPSPSLCTSTTSCAMPVVSVSSMNGHGSAELSSISKANITSKPLELNNPWDWVPDQPSSAMFKQPSTQCDSVSSGLSMGSVASLAGGKKSSAVMATTTSSSSSSGSSTTAAADSDISLSFDEKLTNGSVAANAAAVADDFWSTASVAGSKDMMMTCNGILDDPFDAEWAALAMRNSINKNNPFLSTANKPDNAMQKAFELQM